jgi:nucleotide-binding universal stress UspA family protein
MVPARESVLSRILVAVGGSETSIVAVRHAMDLAQAGRGTLEALVVQETTVAPELLDAKGQALARLAPEIIGRIQRSTDEVEMRVRSLARGRGQPLRIHRETDLVSDALVRAAPRSSLVIMGRHGHRTARGGVLGSNTEIVLRRVRKPILVTGNAHRPIRHVLVAYDGRAFAELALGTGVEIAAALSAPLEILTVGTDTDACRAVQQRARRILNGTPTEVTYSHAKSAPTQTLVERTEPGTLVVMGPYGHTRAFSLMLGSVVEHAIRLGRGPLLVTERPPVGVTA